ncbi:MAG: endonuclease/exonuclease/phosphatase family protein [Verrucomicrobiales bacterium]|nr:endonuclease/exonuclease/phosphatase family protein [Verrucomicrobiales bacterium]
MLIATVLTFAAPAWAERAGVGGKRDVDVMTVNLYVGGDIRRVMGINPADTNYVEELVGAVTGVYYEIVASAPPVRLQTVANQIAAKMPDIVAVEEASLIRVQSPGDLLLGGTNAATDVVYDYLQMLVQDLQARGAHYKVVSTGSEIDIELPMLNMETGMFDDVRLTDREAILVRTDLPPGQLRVSHPQSGNFVNVIPIPALGLSVERGWCSVDVFIRGRNFRCICAHPEIEIWPDIQAAQVQELLAGPANTKLPVILIGDFNADPLHRDGSYAYDFIPAAGFGDAWATLNPTTPADGLTWGHDEFLADPGMDFDRRIDFAFYRGKGIVPVQAEVIDQATGLAEPPLWASDHAALSARFLLK